MSVFATGKRLVDNGATTLLLADDTTGNNNGYPGGSVWKGKLVNLWNIPHEKIRLIPFTGQLLHTLSESIDLVRLAKQEKWKEVVIVAPPFHQLRAFMSVVTALLDVGYTELKVYNHVGLFLPWQEQARHSQGTLTAKRSELIYTEYERITKYQNDGTPVSLLSTRKVLDYLEWRDTV